MPFLSLSFVTSLLVTLLVIRTSRMHGLFSDHQLSGPQKFHAKPVPRIGGVGVFVALVAGATLAQYLSQGDPHSLWLLLLCSLPAFLSGVAEDLTKNVSARRRLFFTAMSAALAIVAARRA